MLLLAGMVIAHAQPNQHGSAGGLLELARQQGQVAVIVTLNNVAAGDQAAIASAQAALIEQLTQSNAAVDNLKSYRFLPQLALTVDADGLRVLMDSALVQTLTGDGLAQPSISAPQ